MKIIYVHHALRKKGNPPTQDDDIEQIGVEDAENVAKILSLAEKYLNIKAIYTSPFLRCKKTSEIINKYIKVPIYDEPRLNECGSFYLESKKENTKTKESWFDCQLRTCEAIKDIVKKYDKQDTVICVTSGVNLTAFISLAYKIAPSKDLPFPMVPSCSLIGFDLDIDSF